MPISARPWVWKQKRRNGGTENVLPKKKNNGYRRSKGDLRAYLSIAKDQDRVIKKDGFFQA